MSKALFINMLGHGHVNPTIGIVKELINRGEDVTYIAGEEFRDKIENTGAKFKGHKNSLNPSNFINGKLSLEDLEKEAISTVKEIIEAVFNSNEKFDYIIYDSAFIIGPEIGRVLKIPTVSSITTFAINEKIITNNLSSQFNRFRPKLNEIKLKIQRVLDALEYDLQQKYGMKFSNISTEVTGEGMLNTGKGMLNIVYTSKYFQPYGESFDESYKFIGSSITDRKEDMGFSLETNDNKKVIYISLGTLFNNSIEFYENCFKAFDDIDAKIIMSIGKNIDINTFKFIPSNFIVRNYVPQLEVLKHTDVFITHGGMNSTNEGLYYNIPLILIPQSGDQPFVANRVAQLGAGIVIEKDKITPEILKQSVVKILSDNNFRINSEKIGESLREAGGYEKGVDEILNLKSSVK